GWRTLPRFVILRRMQSGVLTLVLLLLCGGSGDLLDYVPADAYWKERGVPLTVEKLAAELTPVAPPGDAEIAALVQQIVAPDPQNAKSAARRLLDAGRAAVPRLEVAARGDSPELAARAV